jgi:hypothetical protein
MIVRKGTESERPDYWRKQVRQSEEEKGTKGMRGQPEIWDELKEDIKIKLTPTAKRLLHRYALLLEISRSEIIERVIRGELNLQEINRIVNSPDNL